MKNRTLIYDCPESFIKYNHQFLTTICNNKPTQIGVGTLFCLIIVKKEIIMLSMMTPKSMIDDCVYLIEEKQLHVKNSTIVSRNLGRYLIKKSNKAHKYVLPLASRDERHND